MLACKIALHTALYLFVCCIRAVTLQPEIRWRKLSKAEPHIRDWFYILLYRNCNRIEFNRDVLNIRGVIAAKQWRELQVASYRPVDSAMLHSLARTTVREIEFFPHVSLRLLYSKHNARSRYISVSCVNANSKPSAVIYCLIRNDAAS